MAKSVRGDIERPQQHIKTASQRVREYSERIMSWTGINRKVLTWMALLETKAEHAGGMLASSTAPVATELSRDFTLATEDSRTPAEMIYDTINEPAFEFYVKSQSFTRKIIKLDKWHHRRGTLQAEYEILQECKQVVFGSAEMSKD